jgi:hypothetical protein
MDIRLLCLPGDIFAQGQEYNLPPCLASIIAAQLQGERCALLLALS